MGIKITIPTWNDIATWAKKQKQPEYITPPDFDLMSLPPEKWWNKTVNASDVQYDDDVYKTVAPRNKREQDEIVAHYLNAYEYHIMQTIGQQFFLRRAVIFMASCVLTILLLWSTSGHNEEIFNNVKDYAVNAYVSTMTGQTKTAEVPHD